MTTTSGLFLTGEGGGEEQHTSTQGAEPRSLSRKPAAQRGAEEREGLDEGTSLSGGRRRVSGASAIFAFLLFQEMKIFTSMERRSSQHRPPDLRDADSHGKGAHGGRRNCTRGDLLLVTPRLGLRDRIWGAKSELERAQWRRAGPVFSARNLSSTAHFTNPLLRSTPRTLPPNSNNLLLKAHTGSQPTLSQPKSQLSSSPHKPLTEKEIDHRVDLGSCPWSGTVLINRENYSHNPSDPSQSITRRAEAQPLDQHWTARWGGNRMKNKSTMKPIFRPGYQKGCPNENVRASRSYPQQSS